MCWANRHTFTWGSSTAVDAMPLSLRCECGAISREDADPMRRLQAENDRLRAALPGAPSGDVQASAVLRRTLGEMGVCISEAMAARGIASWGDGDDLLVGLLDTVRAALAATDRPAAEGER